MHPKHRVKIEKYPMRLAEPDSAPIGKWRAECDCGWAADRSWLHAVTAQVQAIEHLHEVLEEAGL